MKPVESLCDGNWLSVLLVTAAAGERLGTILSLPEVEEASTVCFLEIVGVRAEVRVSRFEALTCRGILVCPDRVPAVSRRWE